MSDIPGARKPFLRAEAAAAGGLPGQPPAAPTPPAGPVPGSTDFFSRSRQLEALQSPTPFAERSASIQEEAQAYSEQRRQNLEKYDYALPVSDWEYDLVNRAVASSADPENEAYKWATAIQY
jgi:hypothetical protein